MARVRSVALAVLLVASGCFQELDPDVFDIPPADDGGEGEADGTDAADDDGGEGEAEGADAADDDGGEGEADAAESGDGVDADAADVAAGPPPARGSTEARYGRNQRLLIASSVLSCCIDASAALNGSSSGLPGGKAKASGSFEVS
jgi:hypothetical protein